MPLKLLLFEIIVHINDPIFIDNIPWGDITRRIDSSRGALAVGHGVNLKKYPIQVYPDIQ